MCRKGMEYKYTLENGELNPLAKHEVYVIQLLCEGKNILSIAETLYKSKETINKHIRSAKTKVNASSRDQLIAICLTKGLLDVNHLK